MKEHKFDSKSYGFTYDDEESVTMLTATNELNIDKIGIMTGVKKLRYHRCRYIGIKIETIELTNLKATEVLPENFRCRYVYKDDATDEDMMKIYVNNSQYVYILVVTSSMVVIY